MSAKNLYSPDGKLIVFKAESVLLASGKTLEKAIEDGDFGTSEMNASAVKLANGKTLQEAVNDGSIGGVSLTDEQFEDLKTSVKEEFSLDDYLKNDGVDELRLKSQ